MEKYDAILRAINDKIVDQESTISFYREETGKKTAEIQKLTGHIESLESKFKERSRDYEALQEAFDKKLDEISELKAANAKLTAKINEIEKF